jgi:DNA modification methylase
MIKETLLNQKGAIMLDRAESQFWAYDTKLDAKEGLVLLDNVQFIYELSLAQLELRALGIDFEVTNGLRQFKVLKQDEERATLLKKRTAYFKAINGQYTDYFYIIQENRTRSVNQYLTHWIYPYKGKFHPQMIRALLNIIGLKQGEIVFEPFSGSGTTALEAQLLGINFVGIDISPLCVLQGKVKTKSVGAVEEIIAFKDAVISKLRPSLFNKESDFYRMLDEIQDGRIRDFYSLARLLAISDESRRGREFEESFIRNVGFMIESVNGYSHIVSKLGLKLGDVNLAVGDARNIGLADNSVDGIITSPPYSIALDYVENDAHSLADMGYRLQEIREDFIGVRGKGKERVNLYNDDMKRSYSEMYRVLKPDKFAVIVVGNATYQGQEVKTVELTIRHMEELGFELVKNIDKIIFGLYNVMKNENILIFRKMK